MPETKRKTISQEELIKKAALAEKLRRLKYEKYRYYVPTGAGEEFIKKVGSGKYFVVANFAANGVGKTTLAVNILAHLFFPCGSIWFDKPLFRDFPYPKRVRVVSDPSAITSAIIPELKKWFPKGRYETDKRGKNYEFYWKTDTGWEFDIMSYDQDPKEFESATIGLVWFDEPPPYRIYKATVARLRRGGLIMITATPLEGSGWMYDHIVANTKHEEGLRTYVTADIESACIEHGVRGFLKHEDIVRMISEYSEEEKQARVYGKFQKLVGLVFKQFERNVHVIKPFNIDQQNYCVWEMLDPHPRTEDAITWIAIDRKGTKYVVDELFIKAHTEELAAKIKAKASQFRIVKRLADPSAFDADKHNKDGKSLADRLADYGLVYGKATKTREQADRRLGDALNFVKVGNEMLRAPELYFFETCQRSIWEMEHYRWDEWRGKLADYKDKKQKPIDKDDHMIENIGRCLVQEPAFVPYVPILPTYARRQPDAGAIGSDTVDDPYE